MATLRLDLLYAIRQLRKAPAFTLTILLTLALGIGANAAIFTLVDTVLLRSLPVADPKSLIRLGDNDNCCYGTGLQNTDYTVFSTDTYRRLRHSNPEFADLAAMESGFIYRPIIARRDGAKDLARSVMGEFVSGNYFRTFGLQPAAGRLLLDSDDVQGAPVVAIMSYDTWQHDFNADPAVVGGTFWINTKAVTIVGIAPPGFFGDRITTTPPEFYLPIESMDPIANTPYIHDPGTQWLYVIGRVKPGVVIPALQEKLSTQLKHILTDSKVYSGSHDQALLAKAHIVLTPGGSGIQTLQAQYASHLHLLMAVSGLVLLIACANIANLLLVRGVARRSEISVRTALGAMRSRIIRQLLTESLLISVLGGAAGLVIAYAGTRMLLGLAFPGTQNMPIQAAPSPPVIGFAFALSLLTGLLFGLAPAWISSEAEPAYLLRSGATRTATGGASLLQSSLVVFQAALSLVLLVGAGLFAQSLGKLQSTDLKLDPHNRYIVHLNPQAAGYTQTQLDALYRTIEERFHALPGIVNVGLANYTAMEDNDAGSSIRILGQPDLNRSSSYDKITPEYFASIGTRLLAGRNIGPQDTPTSPTVAVVNQSFVDSYLKGLNPIGQHFGFPKSPGEFKIVGVVQDTPYESVRWQNHRMYFTPLLQRPASDKSPIETNLSLYAGAMVLQTNHPMPDLASLTRHTLASINPNLSVVKFQPFQAQIADRFTDERMISRLTLLFAALALLLASFGLYGVTAYTIVRRTSEIGIRMALGAQRSSVVAMIMRRAMLQTLLGLAIGVPVALVCVRLIKSELYDITHADVPVLAGAIVALAASALIAGFIPGRRAASINPAQALRSE